MNKIEDQELISALADGQLHGEAFARAIEAATASDAALRTWQAYHLVGDVLRSRELAAGSAPEQFLARLRPMLQAQQMPRPALQSPSVTAAAQQAANDGSFRWKLVAGFATVTAMAAIGWTVTASGLGSGSAQPQLAVAPAAAPAAAAAPVVAVSGEQGKMIRDPRLDQFLAAHRQFGGANALQAPAGFLRNATFEGPAR